MKYGLIAGNGRFPFLVLEGAKGRGADIVVAAIKEETDAEIDRLGVPVEWLSVGQLGRLLRFFHNENVTHVIMAGQVKHHQIFKINALPDMRMVKMLARLAVKNTDSLIGAVADELEREGMKVVDSTIFLEKALAPEGILTRRAPSKAERDDIDYGLEVAREISRLDLGQTIAVKERAVVAIEAMEGTDIVIRRAGEITRGRAFSVIKVAKPKQDMRFDVPVVGVATVDTMARAGATALSITAGRTLIFDKEELIKVADQKGISIIGLP